LKVRRAECETLYEELEALSAEDLALRDQLATIQRLIDCQTGPAQIAAEKIMKKLYGGVPVERGARGRTTIGRTPPV
jgi:sensor domain CHASE-containing protein